MHNISQFQWQRYWVARDGTIHIGHDGFPIDPSDSMSPNTGLMGYAQISQIPCLALLGEPGMGKTYALGEIRSVHGPLMRKNGDEQLFLDLRSYGSEERLYKAIFESAAFSSWVNGTHVLEIILDSLDECLITNRTAAGMLVDELKKYPRSRLRLRIACRTGEWPMILENELPRLWPSGNYAAFELAPLLRRDVDDAVIRHSIPHDRFNTLLQQKGIVALATRPLTLRFLIGGWSSEGFKGSQVELYKRGCRMLCEEHNSNRHDMHARTLDADQALAIAARIAAVMIFGKRATICDDAKSSSDELSFTDFCDGTEPDVTGHTISVTSARVREVVNNTGLFSGRSDNQMGWSHWSFAEYLAAHYLAIRSLDTTQVLSLITQPSGSVCEIRRVVPQLRETAGWLCAMRPEFIEHFIQGDPEILLRSAEISLDETLRQKVVQSLLEKVKTGWRRPAEPFVRRDYSNLAYPGLADQLRPYICDKQEDIRVREVASEIAEHCNVRQLLPELTKVALDSCETPHMRSAAAHHVVRFNDETYILKLRPLLKLSSAEDPDRDLMGMALRALWPDHTTASELFEHLLIAPKPSYYGAYAIFLHRLPATLTSEQLPIVLKWAINQPQDHLLTLEFGQLIARAIYMACEHIDVDGVLPALVQLFVARLQRCDPLMPPCLDANVEPQFKHSAALRQRIMDAIIDQLPISDQFITVKVEELCLPEDVPWLVGRIILTSGGVRDRWFACLMAAYDYSTSMQLDAILDGMRQSEYLKTRLQQRFAPIELNSKEGQKIKADYLRHQRLIHRPRRQKPMLPQQLEDILKKHLDEAEAGNLDAWWRMNLDMTVCPPTAQYPLDAEFQSDLTELPGWKLLDPQDRERSVQVAATYLQDGEPNDSLWLGKNVLHRPAAAGYRAIRLLKKEAPAILKSLPAALWRKWTTIIVAFPEGNRLIDNDDLTEITALAYQAARDAIIDALKVMIKKENKELGHIFVLRRMERCWDKFLAQTILQYVHEEPLKMESVGDVFSELLKHQPANAVEVIEFFQSLRQIEPTDYLLSAKLAAVLLTYAPHKAWTSVWLTMRLNDEFGKAVITNLATQHDHNCAGNIATHIDETDVAQFYVYISRLFPHAQDPHFEETHAVQAREAIGMFRDGILRALQDRGTLGACKAIDHIIAKLPKLTWMKYVRPVAVEAMLKETWHGQSPKTIFALVESKERRVIENGTQLLDALTESLRRLEKTLHGATPSVGDLWDERSKQPKNENRLSDYLKRHFENDLKGRGIVVNREVEIRKPIAGKGQNTDILVQAFRSNDPHDLHDPISVIIEIKGCWNRALKTSMKTQLKDRYLKKNNQCQHGLYLIGWFNCSKWSRNDYRKKQTPRWSIIKAREHFERQADDLSLQGGIELRAFVLNAGLNQ